MAKASGIYTDQHGLEWERWESASGTSYTAWGPQEEAMRVFPIRAAGKMSDYAATVNGFIVAMNVDSLTRTMDQVHQAIYALDRA